MASPKHRCPSCNALALDYQKGLATDLGDHELENARVVYYKCSACGCYVKVETPLSKMTVIRKGRVTEDMARRVLSALGLLDKFPELPRTLRKDLD